MKAAIIAWLKIQVFDLHSMQRATAQDVLSGLHEVDPTGETWSDNLPDFLEAAGHPELAERAVADGLGYAETLTAEQIVAALQAAVA